ncbi:hypothetical protein F5Y05DRAFT_424223 [Hypoxylon sp. FL0543]|nr:hypothetical protein F5Y05DRAFT_424223 [Hypoxylon sp. FL0543]
MDSDLQPDLRPSYSFPSLKAAGSRPASIHSTGSKGGAYRHGLLKSDSSTDHSTKELPIPPVLSQGPSEPVGRNITMKHRFPSVSVPTRNTSTANIASHSEGSPIVGQAKRLGVVCIDPRIHPPGMHADIHHPGLVSGADFCDAGLTVDHDSPIRTPPSRPSPVNMPKPILTGRVYRLLSGGDLCEEEVDVSDHIHKAHSSAVKVRPALGLLSNVEPHEGHTGTSKVRPFLEFTPQGSESNNIHEGHSWIQKVQPHYELPPISFETEDNLIPISAMEEDAQQVKNSSRTASYWGFLPKFGERNDEEVAGDGKRHVSLPESRDKPFPPCQFENRHSLSASQYSASLKSCDANPKTVGKVSNQENVQHTDESTLPSKATSNSNPSYERLIRDDGKEREVSMPSVSPTSRPLLVDSNRDDQEHGIIPEGIEPRRAASWIRQFLGYPESETPNLTQLPKKSHPRHEDHDDYPNNEANAATSRVTTFSGENAADAGAMDTTMRNLERLLGEVLFLANEVTEQDPCEHVNDNKPSSGLSDTSETAQPQIDEKLKDDAHEPILTGASPRAFTGAVEDFEHSCEVLPSDPEKSRKLRKPGMRSGNTRRSQYLNKRRRPRGIRKPNRRHPSTRETRFDIPDDHCVLPMPPPDNQLKRQRLSPIPHAYDEDDTTGTIAYRTKDVPNSREVREYIRVFHQPPITTRRSSRSLREASQGSDPRPNRSDVFYGIHCRDVDVCSLDGGSDEVIDFSTQYNLGGRQETELVGMEKPTRTRDVNTSHAKAVASQRTAPSKRVHELRHVSLRGRSHVSIREGQRFSLAKSMKRQPTIARDWSPMRKRLVASVACISTALVGILIGIYAGLVPSIQYFIADFDHYSILGNVGLYVGMALSSFLCWPLPLLHGRKTYIVSSLCIAMPLLFPQAITVSAPRSPYTSLWRWALLFPRAVMGFALGFANMNFHSILTDLFGASLMCSNPHQEVVDHHDVRRHGGGLGIWLGIWTWCFIGSLGVGFLVGAVVIDSLRPSWGFYISIILIAVVLLLNVLCPEVRRSGWRRSVAEVKTGSRVSRRVARGEIMMHRVKDGPKWWGQEMYHGVALSLEMLRQPGFVAMATYSAWIYAQVVLIIVLLGSLTSRYYYFRSPYVGAAVSSVSIGALLAVPFQKANIFSHSRTKGPLTNSMTFGKRMTWSSHLVRRAMFLIVLPIAGILYTIVSSGPPVHLVFPCIFAAMIGFLSCLAIAECNGILMEAWDCSDLQPGMTGRSKSEKDGMKRMNYSSFPRVTAGWNIIHSIGFILAAAATSVGGIATRGLGQKATTGVVAAILLIHSLLLLAVFVRFRKVQIIPNSKSSEMDKWTQERRDSLRRRASAIAAAKANGIKDVSEIPEENLGWRPIIPGNPSEKFRRMNILELGSLTRWSEIRKKNRLIDEGVHLNREAVGLARDEIGRRGTEFMDDIHQGAEMLGDIVRKVSKRSMRSKRSHDSDHDDTSGVELQDVGPVGPPGAGLDHQHPTLPRGVYLERECVMGQTVAEEAEETSSESDVDYGWSHTREHSSHMMSKVRPYTGFEEHLPAGDKASSGDYVIDMDASPGEHTSHMERKVRPTYPAGSQHQEQHGSHMQTKVRPANVGLEDLEQDQGARAQERKVKPADAEFEDVDLGSKSGRKDSKALKQD